MGIKVIPLSEFAANPNATLAACVASGDAFVVELPDHSLVSIQGLEPTEDDSLIDELLASNPAFRAVLERSKGSPRKPFPAIPDA
jgi:hypothetical protein